MKEKIFWLGHGSIRIEGEKIIYIDPWKVGGKPKADVILITHSHYDHFSPPDIEKLRKPETVIVAPQDCAKQLKEEVITVKPGDKISVMGLEIEAVPAYNPQKPYHPKTNGWLGYIISTEGKRIYYAGDTDVIPEMKDIKADIAILPVGGTYTMNAEEAAKAADILQPELAIPIHCGDIVGELRDAERFRDLAKTPVEVKKIIKD